MSRRTASIKQVPLSEVTPAHYYHAGGSPRATLDRVEQMINILRTRRICPGWKMNEEGAAATLQYFRRVVADPTVWDRSPDEDDEEQWCAMMKFFSDHGQSLDWVFDGNPLGMICSGARQSLRAATMRAGKGRRLKVAC